MQHGNDMEIYDDENTKKWKMIIKIKIKSWNILSKRKLILKFKNWKMKVKKKKKKNDEKNDDDEGE